MILKTKFHVVCEFLCLSLQWGMRMRRLSVAAIVGLGALAFAGSAQACSCAPPAPRQALRQSDAALVGTLVKVVPRDPLWADYRYRVTRVYRGGAAIGRGDTISVRSARRAAACALPRRLDRRYGLFLTRRGGHWRAGMCSTIAPRRLWLAARRAAAAGASAAPLGCAS
jgi:hypothetical protein